MPSGANPQVPGGIRTSGTGPVQPPVDGGASGTSAKSTADVSVRPTLASTVSPPGSKVCSTNRPSAPRSHTSKRTPWASGRRVE